MCGIAGILLFKNGCIAFPDKKLESMLGQLEHRGPDNRGQEIIPCGEGCHLHLGHQRLSIIDLSTRANQPMANDDHSVWISTNSEIYNFRELRQELEGKYRFFSSSDTEVLLRAYEEWGVGCLERLHGMFAFAIWDSQKGTLFLARDRLGIKPLYFYSGSESFVFASELRAVKASGIPDISLNPLGFYNFLSYGRLGSPDTILNNIQELEPASYLVVHPATGNVEKKKYWDPFIARKTSQIGDHVEGHICEHLKEAVRLRMVSDVPLGAFLSGGIDSSAVTALMSEFPGNAIKTLSVVFNEKQFDESEYSSLVAKEFGTEHHVIPLREADFLATLPSAISSMDQPTVDGVNTYVISRAARELGLKVVLSGLGGDELFAGYDSFKMIPRLTNLEQMLKIFPRPIRMMLGQGLKTLLGSSDKNTKLAHLVSGKMNGHHLYFLFRALFCEDQIHQLIEDKGIVECGLQNALQSSENVLKALKSLGPVEKISYLEMTHYMANMLLRDTDMMSMAHALEIRVPLIDHKLVEYMFTVPGRLKIDSRGINKPLLVNSLPRKLPDRVVHRKKMGFTLPFDTWMRTKLKNELENVLLTPQSPLQGIISETAVEQLWRDFLRNRISWSRPWSLFILKNWVERNIN